ncbi:MAG: Gfo/Idh/MocA family oxidoreductase [Armatimonadetes bacterium]|nr:Gfo/Idh/MocA family oxidoreductase [Armatimonadota bacterium]
MKPVRLGIIGCGVMGSRHLSHAAECPAAELVAAADLIPERVQGAAQQYDITPYASGAELLRDDRVEAVVLAMPAGARTSLAFNALERGKHVLLEKPIASHATEVERMIALRGDRVAGCCSCRNTFTGHAQAAARCVESGALGDIRVVRVRALDSASRPPSGDPPPWRQSMSLNGGGILVNWSCYDLDYLMFITGWRLRPRALLARWWPVAEEMRAYVAPGSDADSHYIALAICEGGIVLSMERGEFSSAASDHAWEIIGTKGTLHMPMQRLKEIPDAVILDRCTPDQGLVSERIWEGGQETRQDQVLPDFLAAIQEGRPPRTSLERALIIQKITDAIYASSRSGASVSAQ